MTEPASDLRSRPLAEALGERYLAYALSTIMSRSLPDVRDGLKPVQRRLLHAMRLLRLDPDQGFKKCARVVGDVIGKYHPHGDVAVYDALVRLAQSFAQRYPLVDGQGNFGNVDGDNAAAMRYTEARLTEVAAALLDGLDEDSVDFRPTYDNQEEEPVVLPAAFPNLLANGATGIAVGMATNIPPHNVAEICEALIFLIKNPEASTEKLVEKLPGPDFPTGGVLIEPKAAIIEAYETGRGGFRQRAAWNQEKLKGGGWQIVVTEIPYQVQKAKLVEQIAELITSKKLVLLGDVRDESTDDIRLVLEPKSRNVDPAVLMESLFKATDLEVRISLNMNVLDRHNVPRVMGLREVLQAFLDHRLEVLERRTRYRLGKIAARLEVLAGYLIAYLNIDEVIRIIRFEDEPKAELIKRFDLSEVQADAILNLRLRALHKLEEIEIRKEHDALSAEQADLEELMANEARRWQVIAKQIRETGKKFGTTKIKGGGGVLGTRRTVFAEAPTAVVIPIEAVIEREPVTVVCSAQGWIRTLRGHLQDTSEIRYKEGDGPRFVLHAETTDKLIIFGSNGRFYTLGVDKLPGGRGHGEPLRLSIDLPNDSDVLALFLHRSASPSPAGETADPDASPAGADSAASAGSRLLLLAASDGRGFLVAEADILAQTRAGKQIMTLGEGARALTCRPIASGEDHVAALGDNGRLLLFPLEEVSVLGRGRGVVLMKLRETPLVKENLLALTAFRWSDGLTVHTDKGPKTFEPAKIQDWLGRRAQVGRRIPSGWPKGTPGW